jgi:type II secretory ATPase GspE/PulE/Tfp pilus assembly ATPase PilB-like protein
MAEAKTIFALNPPELHLPAETRLALQELERETSGLDRESEIIGNLVNAADQRLKKVAPKIAIWLDDEIEPTKKQSAYDQASTTTAEDLMIDLEEERLDAVATELLSEPLDLLESGDSAPIIKLVNGILSQAVKKRASDVYVEPFEKEMVVRFLVDGKRYDVLSPPKRFQPAITSRVKVMAGLNIAEKRLPQDGRIRLRTAGRDIDLRVSSIPTAFGERIVLRLLDCAQAGFSYRAFQLGWARISDTEWGLASRVIQVNGKESKVIGWHNISDSEAGIPPNAPLRVALSKAPLSVRLSALEKLPKLIQTLTNMARRRKEALEASRRALEEKQ